MSSITIEEITPIFYETRARLKHDPKKLHDLTGQELVRGLAAVWSKEGILLLDARVCTVEMAWQLGSYARANNCGKCIPCREGSRQIAEILERLVLPNRAKEGDLLNLLQLTHLMAEGSDCSFGETIGYAIADILCFENPAYNHYQDEVARDPRLYGWLKNGEFLAHIRGDLNCKSGVYTALHFTPCQLRCPLGTDIAYFLAAININKATEAKSHVSDVNYIPRALSKVCGLCKAACTLAKDRNGAIDINGLKSFACFHSRPLKEFEPVHIDRASFALSFPLHGIVPADYPETVAVVGGGPAGLISAAILSRSGYKVTLFEREPQLGGLTRYGIPRARLSNATLDADLKELFSPQYPITVKLNTQVGRNVDFGQLVKEFNAVVLACGAQQIIKAGIENEDHPQVLNFLKFMHDFNTGQFKRPGEPVSGGRAAVIGAGNSAMDVSVAAKKLGYQSTVYYRKTREFMRADPHEINIAEDAGVLFEFEMVPKAVVIENGRMTGIMFEKNGQPAFRPADILVPAIGQMPDFSWIPTELGLKISDKGLLWVNPLNGATSHPKIFACGDIFAGRTVANSLQEGVRAALGIHQRLHPQANNAYLDNFRDTARKIACHLSEVGDPFKEELRQRWNFSLKSYLRRRGRNDLQAAQSEAGACQCCRQFVLIARVLD